MFPNYNTAKGAESSIDLDRRKVKMGLQKFRADIAGKKQSNGAVPYYSDWLGGPSLALVRNCPVANKDIPPRTVYVRGEADTYFSIPAACKYKGKTVSGYITTDDNREYVFRAHNDSFR